MKKLHWIIAALFFLLAGGTACSGGKGDVTIVTAPDASNRIAFGAEKLENALEQNGHRGAAAHDYTPGTAGKVIAIGAGEDAAVGAAAKETGMEFFLNPGKEGFTLRSAGNVLVVNGGDASGALYGCMELIDRLKTNGALPDSVDMTDRPEMVLRGSCIGLQKTTWLPGRGVYEYPYTPENFPWFYDKELWVKYLDMLVENRMNSVYLWNGHPFASLVKLEDYPFAVEVDDETFQKNQEMFSFLTQEADKRGIFVIQMFYNIILSKPFAEHYGLRTQERSRQITPLISDYTRKSIAAFVENYPNVGLLVCLGEAMDTYEDDVEFFTETIIPGVKDGLKALGRTDEPPILVRAHDTNCQMVMDAALPIYKNLYTMHKYNGESLTTYEPRGPWSKIHTDLSSLGSIHIENVHILANLEPFRWGSPAFVQKAMRAMHTVHGANGLHLYPQASYWDWPYSADKLADSTRLLEMDRDWIWYEAWARYAWKCNRDQEEESRYWSARLGDEYGCSPEYGREIMAGYDQMGEISPKLLRKFGITEGNRQTMLLGMFMSQLVNPAKWTVYEGFHSSCGPVGERLQVFMEKEWNKQPHVGETPPQLIAEAVEHGRKAVEAMEKAAPHVTRNKEEFGRLKNDAHAYYAYARYFAEKVKAAMLVLEYNYSRNVGSLEKAAAHLDKSLDYYRELVDLTKDTYHYANSMLTRQRRIPIGSDGGRYSTWAELLPLYEAELTTFRKNIDFLKTAGGQETKEPQPLRPADVKFETSGLTLVPVKEGQTVFADRQNVMGAFAPELTNLKAVKTRTSDQRRDGTQIVFTCDKPVQVLVGYFASEKNDFLRAPVLETDATANEYGQAEIKIANAVEIKGMPAVNIHAYSFGPGKNTLNLGKGTALVLGFADGTDKIAPRDAGLASGTQKESVDWLFY